MKDRIKWWVGYKEQKCALSIKIKTLKKKEVDNNFMHAFYVSKKKTRFDGYEITDALFRKY